MIRWLLVTFIRLYCGVRVQPAANKQCVYVANHTSHLDVLLLLAALPPSLRWKTRPVADAAFWTAGRVRRYLVCKVLRGVLLEKDRGGFDPLEAVAEALDQGDSLILFPEGTRGPGHELLPLKSGVFYIARRFPCADVVPVWIENAYRILPRDSAIPVPLLCPVRFGEPLHDESAEREDDFLLRIRAALEELRGT